MIFFCGYNHYFAHTCLAVFIAKVNKRHDIIRPLIKKIWITLSTLNVKNYIKICKACERVANILLQQWIHTYFACTVKFWHPFFHETVAVTYDPAVPVAVLNTALLCIKTRIFHSQNRKILIKYKYKDWILLVIKAERNDGRKLCVKNFKLLARLLRQPKVQG